MVIDALPPFLNRVPERLRRTLSAAPLDAIARAESFLKSTARPCVYFDSKRTSDLPLQRGLVGRLLGRPTVTPQLPVLASKFGGQPYVTADEVSLLRKRRFLLQINFAEVPEIPESLPKKGILCVDLDPTAGVFRWFAIRYYAEVSDVQAAVVPPTLCVGNYEAALRFIPGVSYPQGETWESVLADEDDTVREAWAECQFEIDCVPQLGTPRWCLDAHRLGGYRTCGQDDDVFKPPTGYPTDIHEYELLLRVPFDNTADFGWGSNTAYIVIHRDDLAACRLERAFGAPANV
jgi:Domain of unknown function (DUF1963)